MYNSNQNFPQSPALSLSLAALSMSKWFPFWMEALPDGYAIKDFNPKYSVPDTRTRTHTPR